MSCFEKKKELCICLWVISLFKKIYNHHKQKLTILHYLFFHTKEPMAKYRLWSQQMLCTDHMGGDKNLCRKTLELHWGDLASIKIQTFK